MVSNIKMSFISWQLCCKSLHDSLAVIVWQQYCRKDTTTKLTSRKGMNKNFCLLSGWSRPLTASLRILFRRRPLWQDGTCLEKREEECGPFTDRLLRISASDTRMLWMILAPPTTGTHLVYTWETRLEADTRLYMLKCTIPSQTHHADETSSLLSKFQQKWNFPT